MTPIVPMNPITNAQKLSQLKIVGCSFVDGEIPGWSNTREADS